VTLNANGYVVALTDNVTSNGRTSTTVYDAVNRTRTVTDAAGRVTVTTFDSQERQLSVSTSGLVPVSYLYDSRGRLTTTTEGEGANQRTTMLSYDALGHVTTYSYDAANRLVQTTRNGVVTTYGYDGWGNLVQETVNGVTTEFVLDENTAYTRILGEVRSDGGERLYAYGPEGFSAQQTVGGAVESLLR
jgi:YD repeat-containing protein